jgi:hypothetical protein
MRASVLKINTDPRIDVAAQSLTGTKPADSLTRRGRAST